MNHFSRTLSFIAAIALAPLSAGFCNNDPDGAAKKPTGTENSEDKGERRGPDRDRGDRESRWKSDRGRYKGGRPESHPFFKLSEEDRKRVRAALSQVWNDPELQAAREQIKIANDAHREAMKSAMMKVDPDIREVLMKVMEPHLRDGDPRRGPGPDRGGRPDFSKEDWKVLGDAHEKAMQSERMKSFKSESEGVDGWREAMARSKEFRDALREEMIKADPRVKPLMERMPKGFPSRRPEGGDERPRRERAEGDRDEEKASGDAEEASADSE